MKKFNESYLSRLMVLVTTAVMRNWKLNNQFGATFSVQVLLHETTPNSLKGILRVIKKKIANAIDQDESGNRKKQSVVMGKCRANQN